ncbi:hypothetical protein SAMN05446037_101673 [Anaerovirgula multivorans]|uniref:Toxin ETX/toxin MTX2 n=1 Tax=Anaerovirgula multivorans TaxID=312168 RepID=A0A239GE80_9FIRM|nr:hypothetical protein [Anaerovirgula multivorans]SNS67507.1 hypothetical protein SAMN05446037_101673 [Anaerovirgula multivorans]
MKKLIAGVICFTMFFMSSFTTFANINTIDDNTVHEFYADIYINREPKVEMPKGIEKEILLTREETMAMTAEELSTAIKEKTELSDEDVSQLVDYYKNADENERMPRGLYDTYTWHKHPYLASSKRYVAYSKTWVGIDAYRSSVGMTKGSSETKSISYTLGFEGSGDIKKVKTTFKSSFTATNSYTVSESATCPAWTTMAWRPYTTYDLETWKGVMKRTTIIPLPNGEIYQSVGYEDREGTNKVEVNKTHEVWSRVNTSKNVNATSPSPPTSAPNVN